MGDIVPIKLDTPKEVAMQILNDTNEDDIAIVSATLADDGTVRIHANPMGADRMYFLAVLIQRYVMNNS